MNCVVWVVCLMSDISHGSCVEWGFEASHTILHPGLDGGPPPPRAILRPERARDALRPERAVLSGTSTVGRPSRPPYHMGRRDRTPSRPGRRGIASNRTRERGLPGCVGVQCGSHMISWRDLPTPPPDAFPSSGRRAFLHQRPCCLIDLLLLVRGETGNLAFKIGRRVLYIYIERQTGRGALNTEGPPRPGRVSSWTPEDQTQGPRY